MIRKVVDKSTQIDMRGIPLPDTRNNVGVITDSSPFQIPNRH